MTGQLPPGRCWCPQLMELAGRPALAVGRAGTACAFQLSPKVDKLEVLREKSGSRAAGKLVMFLC